MYGNVYGMVKTTVYLPEELKGRLERLARDRGRSEAELIRTALEEFTARERPRPTLPLFSRGQVLPIDDWDEAQRGFGED
jgi:metal-responsive CopG/Arc/MetJ family transcriptional regulator